LPPTTVYRLWKSAFVLLIFGALTCAAFVTSARWRTCVLTTCVLVGCYVEPSALVMRWWGRVGLPASRFAAVSDATRYLQQFAPEENRVYTRVDLMAEQFETPPRLEAANLSAVYGLHNVAGYEPLILERYSRALGGVGIDTLRTPIGHRLSNALFTEQSHVLDLLNDRFVVAYAGFQPAFEAPLAGSELVLADLIGEAPPQTMKILTGAPGEAGALVLVTSLANAVNEPDGASVARLRIFTADGRTIERNLRAGYDTAEWAHERADVRAVIKHKLAPVFDQQQVGGPEGYPAYRFQTRLNFEQPTRVVKIEIDNISQTAHLGIYNAKLISPDERREVALTNMPAPTWQPVYEQNDTLILRNQRACPRAWLVTEAEAVDGAEALRRIRGESQVAFDPRRTVLLEVRPNELPQLPKDEAPAPNLSARISTYEPTRLVIDTDAPTATVLVLSEIFYPGWEATVDGQVAEIKVADYLLRGVALPAGQHTIEMRYRAPAARSGAIISVLTLLLLCALFIYQRRAVVVPHEAQTARR
jgi:Bacterial membrane protein YfhO